MELDVPETDIEVVKAEYSGEDSTRQGMIMLQIWLDRRGGLAAEENVLAEALYKIDRADIVKNCIFKSDHDNIPKISLDNTSTEDGYKMQSGMLS